MLNGNVLSSLYLFQLSLLIQGWSFDDVFFRGITESESHDSFCLWRGIQKNIIEKHSRMKMMKLNLYRF